MKITAPYYRREQYVKESLTVHGLSLLLQQLIEQGKGDIPICVDYEGDPCAISPELIEECEANEWANGLYENYIHITIL